MFGRKTDAEVRARRDLKRRAVYAICDVAYAVPLSASRGNRVPPESRFDTRHGDQPGVAVHHEFLADIGKVLAAENAREILTTAKGCSSAPREARGSFHYPQATFYEFLEATKEIDCLGTYMEIAWAWAVQIVRANPTSFPAGDFAHDVIAKVGAAEQGVRNQFQALL